MLIREIWRYRALLWDLVIQDFRGRYAGSVIGVFWNILQPLAQIFIYAVILARVVGSRIPGRVGFPDVDDPYALSIYICSGLLPWLTLSETLTRNATAFLSHSNLIKKVSFPHPILVLYQIISGLITLFIMHVILLLVMLVTGHRLPPCIVWLPLLYVLQGFMTYGLGLFLATATAYFRDMLQFVSIALQVWFWMTPIVYFRELTEKIVSFGPLLLLVNPLYYLSRAFQILFYENIVYYDFLPQGLWPSQSSFLPTLGVLLLCGAVFSLLGEMIYLKLKKELPDQI
ncbi:ABC transporter permease [bacterium]|nr:ABC transporter permease [bacterium]